MLDHQDYILIICYLLLDASTVDLDFHDVIFLCSGL